MTTSQVKIYLFTVQSLIKPESKTGRKTHKFQEGLGTEFYAHLQSIGALVVFADEHHCYYGPAFSKSRPRPGPMGAGRADRHARTSRHPRIRSSSGIRWLRLSLTVWSRRR